MTETAARLLSAGASRSAPRPSRAGTIPPVTLQERDDDLAFLVERLGRARDGRGGVVIVTGESGAGKSTLLQAFADGDGRRGPVLWGACDPLTTPRPLGPLHDVADQLGDDVSRRCCATRANRTRSSRPSSSTSGSTRRSSSSTTCTGPTRARSTCCASCSGASGSPRSLVVGALRDDELGADPSAAVAAR